MILGYTRAGHEVLLPTHRSSDMEKFFGWTRGDHIDASRILREHGERENDPEVGSWCRRWAKVHRAIGKSSRATLIRAAAETAILSRRRR